MGQTKAELSKKNSYWIPKEKYYELVHFCRQYDDYRKELRDTMKTMANAVYGEAVMCNHDYRPVENSVERVEFLNNKIFLIEKCAMEASPELYSWLMQGVTKGYGYGYLSTKAGIPASKDMYYDRYRKFFWLLAQKR